MTAPRKKLRRLDVGAMAASDPPPIPWLVDRIVVKGALTLLAGVAGQGKSLLAMAWALAAVGSAAKTVAGTSVTSGRVLIVDAENGEREIHRRVRTLGLDSDAAERLTIVETEGFDLDADLSELGELLAGVRPSYLVLDSFRSMWRGDERDEAQVADVLDRLRNLIRDHDVGTVLIHHARRDGSGYRGSGAIAASCELAFLLNRAADDPRRNRRRLVCEKSRPAPEPPALWVSLASEDDLERGLPLICEAEPFAKADSELAPVAARLADEAVEAISEYGPMIRAEVARRLGRKPTDGSVGRALSDRRLVKLDDDRYDLASHDGNRAGSGSVAVATSPDPREMAGWQPLAIPGPSRSGCGQATGPAA